jgi:colicin import membrane protein
MRGPHLQKTSILSFTILSFALHLTVFAIALIILKQANQVSMPSPYTVSLVNPEVSTEVATGKDEEVAKEVSESSPPSVTPPVAPQKSKNDSAKEKEMVERKLSAMAAKKKIENIVKLRSMIDLRARGDKRVSNAKASSLPRGKGGGSADYYSTITKVIWQQWVYPDTGKKDIEAIISVKILRDGTSIVQKVEKSSGNALFDRSAISAIAKASPLPPPPQEMEIGVRFYP